MKRAPSLWNLEDLPGMRPNVAKVIPTIDQVLTNIDGQWLPARPLGYYSFRSRLKLAWKVFTGELDALKWPGNQ